MRSAPLTSCTCRLQLAKRWDFGVIIVTRSQRTSSIKRDSGVFEDLSNRNTRMATEDGDPATPGLSEEELQALEDRLVQKILAKVAPKEPGSSSDTKRR